MIFNKTYFLTKDLKFSKDISNAILLNIEYITRINHRNDISNIRVLIGCEYVCIDGNSISLTNKKTDNTILTKTNSNILSNFGYLTCDSTYKLNVESIGESAYFFTKLEIMDLLAFKITNK